ncbi:MAG: choice-of-anchor P family protein [Stellaceae bacterium]
MRIACAAVAALLAVFAGTPARATPFVASSAYVLSADLTYRGVTTDIHPVGRVSGAAPPAYDKSRKIGAFDETIELNPASFLAPTLQIDAGNAKTHAASAGIGIDAVSASGSARIGSIGLSLTSGRLFPQPLSASVASFLDLSVSAKNIRSSADWSEVFPNRAFATGDASFGSLVLGGTLVGGVLRYSGDAAPNTVIFSTPTVTVTLDKQFETELISCSLDCRITPYSITTEAIDISLDNALVFGQRISGDIVIGQSYADPPAPVAEPGALALILLGVAGTIGLRRRTTHALG